MCAVSSDVKFRKSLGEEPLVCLLQDPLMCSVLKTAKQSGILFKMTSADAFSNPISEPEPESTDAAAKVLWTVLCAIRGQKYPRGGDEQHSASCGENAPEI